MHFEGSLCLQGNSVGIRSKDDRIIDDTEYTGTAFPKLLS